MNIQEYFTAMDIQAQEIIFLKFFKNRNYLKLKNSLFNYRLRKHIFKQELQNHIKDNLKLLEIGSGVSPITNNLPNAVYSELSHVAVEYLKKTLKYNSVQDDITKSNFNKNQFDIVIASEVFEHIEHDEAAFFEIARIMKENGLFLISVPVHQWYWGPDDKLVGHYRRYSEEMILKAFNRVGFKMLKKIKIGNPFERMITLILSVMFIKSHFGKDNNKNPNDILVWLFDKVNFFLFVVARTVTYFTPSHFSSIDLYIGKRIKSTLSQSSVRRV